MIIRIFKYTTLESIAEFITVTLVNGINGIGETQCPFLNQMRNVESFHLKTIRASMYFT